MGTKCNYFSTMKAMSLIDLPWKKKPGFSITAICMSICATVRAQFMSFSKK
jgi:hypothetical protein